MSRKIGHMDFDLATTIVDGAVEAFGPTINFNLNGLGEPLSYKHLPDLIRYIGDNAPRGRVELFSSLVASKDRVHDVCVALNQIPNNVLFATTCHLRDDKGELLSQTLNNFQFETVYNMLYVNPRIDLHVATNRSVFTTEDDIEKFKAIFLPLLGEERVHVVDRLDPWLGYISDVAVETSEVTSQSVCDYPFNVLHVGWDGTCLICCTDDVNGELPIGKIEKKSDIRDVWFSPLMEGLRERHNNLDVQDLSPCDKCGRTCGYLKR